ncbi:DUF397 domain-containing protein [Streptomyces erythrochromogenes]|uniref:DUF397 domain-containing protein n=1 Tax=Streptomyces erythrochromogenes TaxID=285574 RepID=UPI0034187BF7
MTTTTESPRWFKSSYSGNGGQCIEVAFNLSGPLGLVPVRDSKMVGGPILSFAAPAFSSFVTSVKADQLGAV